MNMLTSEVRSEARAESLKVGIELSDDIASERGKKRIKTYKGNLLSKPQKLPDGVTFSGVIVREGENAVTSGVVPIIFFPHGYTQRALIFIKGGSAEDDDAEEFTVEVMSLQGRGQLHAERLDDRAFKEELY
jgi:hypothetical protein